MALHDCYQSCLHCLGFLSGAMTFPTLTKLDHFHSWVKTGPYTHVTKTYVWEGLAACRPKANKQARLVERKVCFISDIGNWGDRMADICPKADSPLLTSRGESFYRKMVGGWGGSHAETAQSSLTVVFKLVISGLTSIS